jgi:SAM-dependent methyltransferase
VTLQRAGGAAAFSSSAADYAATMAPAIEPMAAEVVRRAALLPGERVVDLGSGTGTAARLALGEGRTVIGIDAAMGMLDIARRQVANARFIEADFGAIPLPDGDVDVVLAVHALLFADDRVAALREWRRVACPGGRLSLSVPGPGDVVPIAVLGPVYSRYGLSWGDDYPRNDDLHSWATTAGWSDVTVEADPGTAIPLRDDDAFRAWLRVGARGRATGDWSDDRREAFARDLMAATPRDDGGYRLPFGTIYLTARNPA